MEITLRAATREEIEETGWGDVERGATVLLIDGAVAAISNIDKATLVHVEFEERGLTRLRADRLLGAFWVVDQELVV